MPFSDTGYCVHPWFMMKIGKDVTADINSTRQFGLFRIIVQRR